MVLEEKFTLNNGLDIPKLGLGTWFISDKDVVNAVKEAVKLGYRHIDTAQAYRNEKGVGIAVKECGVKREELFITTKLAAEAKSYKKAKAAIDKSLKTMGLDYIDMMIIHSPQPWTKFGETDRYFQGNLEAWKALEEAYNDGKLKAIGVSNFNIDDLNNILDNCSVKPAVNQVLAHASNTPFDIIEFCKEKDILVEGYSPVGHGELFKNDTIVEMAKKYNVSVPQLCIKYDLQLGLLPLPKTANPAHMQNNADMEFSISDEDMNTLKNLEKIKDYGDSSMMPVYGGKLDFKAILSMIFPKKKK